MAIESVEHLSIEEDEQTYNLRVAEVSTFFVNVGASLLVHNTGKDWNQTLYWLLGASARGRETDIDGISMWKTSSEAEVKDLFRVRFGLEGQTGNHAHFTTAQLEAAGIEVPKTPGDGPLNGVLEHHSARPKGNTGDLSAEQIKLTADKMNGVGAGVGKGKAKDLGCK